MENYTLPSYSTSSKRPNVFISHASPDKEAIARPLERALRRFGVDTWLDELSMKPGDSLVRSIDRGLIDCDYAVLIISPDFMARRWPEQEFAALMSREIYADNKVIIPIWFNVERTEVEEYSLILADKVAINATNNSIYEVARRVLAVVNPAGCTAIRVEEFFGESDTQAAENYETVSLASLQEVHHSFGSIILSSSDAISAMLAELVFPMTGEVDFGELFGYLSMEPNPRREIDLQQVLALSYLLTLQRCQDIKTSENERQSLRFFLLGVSFGHILEKISTSLPDKLTRTALATYIEIARLSKAKEAHFFPSGEEDASAPSTQSSMSALFIEKYGRDSKSIADEFKRTTELAQAASDSDDLGAALAYFQDLEPLAIQLSGETSDLTFRVRHNIAYFTGMAGDPIRAATLFAELRKQATAKNGPDHEFALTAHVNQADFLGRSGDYKSACLEYESLIDIMVSHDLTETERFENAVYGLGNCNRQWANPCNYADLPQDDQKIILRTLEKYLQLQSKIRRKSSRG